MRIALTCSAVALALLTSGTITSAAPKPTTPFVPSIGYTVISGNAIELRLATEAGSATVLVDRSPSSITAFDLGPRHTGEIAWAHDRALWARAWFVDGNGIAFLPKRLLFQATSNIDGIDFSPDGTELVFSTLSTTSTPAKLRVIALNNPSVPSLEKSLGFVTGTRWSTDGSAIYFNGRLNSGDPVQIHRLSRDGQTIEPFVTDLAGYTMGRFDTSRLPDATGGRLVATVGTQMRDYWQIDTPAARFGFTIDQASEGHFNCNNSKLLYRNAYQSRRPHYIYDVATGQSTLWAHDSNIHLTDWMPGCL